MHRFLQQYWSLYLLVCRMLSNQISKYQILKMLFLKIIIIYLFSVFSNDLYFLINYSPLYFGGYSLSEHNLKKRQIVNFPFPRSCKKLTTIGVSSRWVSDLLFVYSDSVVQTRFSIIHHIVGKLYNKLSFLFCNSYLHLF